MEERIKLLYNKLEMDIKINEKFLETLLNGEFTIDNHNESINILKEITLLRETVKTLDKYLTK